MTGRRGARAFPVLALIAVTAVWGWTFVIVRDAVSAYPVAPFLALRFILATLVLAPTLLRAGSGLRAGLLPGALLSAGYLAQTVGLRDTTASKAGLLTGLFLVLTPILALVVYHRRPRPPTVIAVVTALIGTILLLGPLQSGGSRELLGDGLEVLTALLFSAHILLLARLPPTADVFRLALAQMLTAAVLFSATSTLSGGIPVPSASVWFAIGVTGTLASALAFWVQTFVQRRVSPERTAVILAAEPAFATLFGLVLAGDRFSLAQGLGAATILLAIGYHELSPLLLRRRLGES